MARIWERSIRRVSLPVAYSEGYNPRPKLHFGLALPTGFESEGEFVDIDIVAEVVLTANAAEAAAEHERLSQAGESQQPQILDLKVMRQKLDEATPDGISVEALVEIDRKETSLQQAVTSCSWEFTTELDHDALQRVVDMTLAAGSLLLDRERKGKQMTDDIRPQILDLHVVDGPRLRAELGTQPRALRPAEFLQAIDMPSKETVRVLRTHQWITNNVGEPAREPLVAGEPATANTEVCAV